MRWLAGFGYALALVASPLSVSAQVGEEGMEPTVEEQVPEEPAPPSEPSPEEPSLQLKLDDAGVGVVPPPPRTFNGYTLEEMRLRAKRAKIGLGVSGGVLLAGSVMGFVLLGEAAGGVSILVSRPQGRSSPLPRPPRHSWGAASSEQSLPASCCAFVSDSCAGCRESSTTEHRAASNGTSHGRGSCSEPGARSRA